MKKIFILLLSLMLIFSFAGCGPTVVEGSKNYENHTSLISIPSQENLYYDFNTKIVYIIFNELSGNLGYGYMSAYYAPNGLPYIYDTETNTLIEIIN